MAVNPLTNKVYVANYFEGNVSVLDALHNTVAATIPCSGAWDVALNPQTNRLYATRDFTWTYSVFDAATNNLLGTVSARRWARSIACNPQTDRIYVSNRFDNWIRVFNGTTNAELSVIPVSGWINDLTVDAQNNLIHAANWSNGSLIVIDGTTNTVVNEVLIGARNSWGVAFNSQSNKIYLSLLNTVGGGELVMMDKNTLTILKKLTIDGAAGIAVNEKTNRIYLTLYGQGSVAILDGATVTNVATLAVGGQWPERVAVHEDLGRAYVTNGSFANTVSVLQDVVPRVQVNIDIKPGSDPNSINCTDANGVIPVAILTTDRFDARTVDHASVRFGKTGTEASEVHSNKKGMIRHEEDVDGDGDIDLVLHFRFGEMGIQCGVTEAKLTGKTLDGQQIEGIDAIRMVGGAQQSISRQETEVVASLPGSFALGQNYPNPFNPGTTIRFELPEFGGQRSEIRLVMLKVYDMLGQEVATLVNEEMKPGSYEVTWDASGVYFYRLTAGSFAETKKLVLMR